MRVFIVYARPSEDSFTRQIRDSFIAGLESAVHCYTISDLYKMNFISDMSEAEYLREAYYRRELPLPADIITEQEKFNSSDTVAFIFPLFKERIIMDGTSREKPLRDQNWKARLDRVFQAGAGMGN